MRIRFLVLFALLALLLGLNWQECPDNFFSHARTFLELPRAPQGRGQFAIGKGDPS